MNLILIAALALAAPPDNRSPRVVPQAVTLDAAIRIAKRRSPDMRIVDANVVVATSRVPQAKALPDPMFMVRLYQVPTNFEIFPVMFELQQTFPWPGKLASRGRAAEAAVKTARSDRAWREAEIKLRVVRSYFQVVTQNALLEKARETRALYEESRGLVEGRLATGRATLADLFRLKGEIAGVDSDVLDLESARDQAKNELTALLGFEQLPMLATLPALREVPAVDAATPQRPDSRYIDATIVQGEAEVAARKRDHYPDVTVGASYMRNFGGYTDMWTAGVALTIPLFYRSKQKRAVDEAVADLSGRRAQRDKRALEAQIEVKQALTRLRAAARHVTLHARVLIPLARETFVAARAGYAAGQTDLVALLEAMRALVMHHRAHVTYLGEFEMRWAELEWATGREFPRR